MIELPFLIKTKEINETLCINAIGSMQSILRFICDEYNVTKEDLIKKDKKTPLPDARHLFFYEAHRQKLGTCENIGKFLDRDHTTVLHGVKKIRGYYEYDLRIKEKVDRMKYMFS